MQGHNQSRWIAKTITKIRKHSDRPIVVRMHPGDGTRFEQIKLLKEQYGDSISISEKGNIREDLVNCWAAVGYNSTPNVVAAIEGIPVFISESTCSWATDIANLSLSAIETPLCPDRTQWINKIANIHWSNYEVESGVLWNNIKTYISSVRP
jgi:hypothetical protein